METALPLNAFVESDLAFTASFESREITLDDTLALLSLLKGVIEAAQFEIAQRTDSEFEILPIVSVSHGSIKFLVKLKPSNWTFSIQTTAREVFLAIALLFPSSEIKAPEPPAPPPVSEPCGDMLRDKYEETLKAWEYFGKGFKGEFEFKCGDATIRSTIDVPPSRK